jgi:methylglutaconyl-CoA hydratase
MTQDHEVLVERRGQALWISINRPKKRNALNDDVLSAIGAAYASAEQDAGVRLVVLTGIGDKAFCAGADLDPGKNFVFDTSHPTTPYADLMRQVRRCGLPTIARVNGACMAGGMGLLCMADLAIASDHAIFGLPEVKIGLFPMQVLANLKDLVPARILNAWCLTGARFDAAEAKASGLLNEVVPFSDLDAAVDRLSETLVGNSPSAIRRGKYALQILQGLPFESAIAFAEGQIALMSVTEDAREGLQSFAEKRTPRWTGR